MDNVEKERRALALRLSNADFNTKTALQAVDSLAAENDVLRSDIIYALIEYAKVQANQFGFDQSMAARLSGHMSTVNRLGKDLLSVRSKHVELERQLADIRTYCNLGSAEELAAAVAGGQRAPVVQSDTDKILEQARQRAEEARKKAANDK